MSKPAPEYRYFIVERLSEYIDPWYTLGLRPTKLEGKERAVRYGAYGQRTNRYHHNRIRYFAHLLLDGGEVDPLVIDNECAGMTILPTPVLLDGHHRLAGAVLAGVSRIRCSYSGRLDVARYLQGDRQTPPYP